jgi:intracellular sulfur oxidation DsrE/DsrF family protein
MYSDFVDILVADARDADAAAELQKNGFRVQCTNTMMQSSADNAALAKAVLGFSSGNQKVRTARETQ